MTTFTPVFYVTIPTAIIIFFIVVNVICYGGLWLVSGRYTAKHQQVDEMIIKDSLRRQRIEDRTDQ